MRQPVRAQAGRNTLGVNLGMFHYHFKNKDNFIRAVLQRLYEAMFADLQLQADAGADALSGLRAAFTVLGGFARAPQAAVHAGIGSHARRGAAGPVPAREPAAPPGADRAAGPQGPGRRQHRGGA
ncbi:hypothetical protein LP420_16605 [Massilia sp. B-10]|nr:hypothetical protein LP420_16605 [Massilia sp. B-10]